jgi:hypothetical protein
MTTAPRPAGDGWYWGQSRLPMAKTFDRDDTGARNPSQIKRNLELLLILI